MRKIRSIRHLVKFDNLRKLKRSIVVVVVVVALLLLVLVLVLCVPAFHFILSAWCVSSAE
jgi:uncharacterized membrane protein